MEENMAKYNRVLLKLSGEALAGEKGTGLDEATCQPVAKQIKKLVDEGTQVAIVLAAVISGEAAPARILTGQKQIRSV